MSLEAYFRATAIVAELRERRPDGVLDICPANAAYQVRFDPDALDPQKLLDLAAARSRARSATRTTSTSTRGSSRSRCCTATRGRTRR